MNIKVDDTSRYADGTREQFGNGKNGVSAAEVQGTGKTKIELDGQNVLDSSASEYWAGLSKKGSGNLTITDETSDKGETITAKEEAETSGSLMAEGGTTGGAAIGGSWGQATDNITIEGYATVKANTLDRGSTLYDDGAGIGGGAGQKAAISPSRAMLMLQQTAVGTEPVSAVEADMVVMVGMRRTSPFGTTPK